MITFWAMALALTIFLYVTLDGFDLGVGMLMAFVPPGRQRSEMLAAIAPVWDGNETWLILSATILFGIFPLAYALLLSAFYLPLTFMLGALIFRGVSFEFRERARRSRFLWDHGFILGSYLASWLQGCAVGALVQGLAIEGNSYVGGPLGWLSPFSLLCGLGLCIGYGLIGAAWLTCKSGPGIRDLGFRMIPNLVGALLIFLATAFAFALADHLRVMHRWIERPLLLIFPALGLLACIVITRAVRGWREKVPFFCAVAIFFAAFGTLAVSFYPFIIPFSITMAQAAAPQASQSFLFWGAGIVVLPLTLIYTLVIYFVFKGKVSPEPPPY